MLIKMRQILKSLVGNKKYHTNNCCMMSWFPFDYFFATFLFSWLFWLPGVLETYGLLPSFFPKGLEFILAIVGIFGPMFGVIVSCIRKANFSLAKSQLKKVLDVKIEFKWLCVIVLGPLAVGLVGQLIFCKLGGDFCDLSTLKKPWIIPLVIPLMFLGGAQEEFGWRGYVLDILQVKLGDKFGTLVLGVFWSAWHLPLFFVRQAGQYYMNIWVSVAFAISVSFVMTWIHNGSGKKPFASVLFHACLNTGNTLFPVVKLEEGSDGRAFMCVVGIYIIWALLIFRKLN